MSEVCAAAIPEFAAAPSWQARLALCLSRAGGRSALASAQHRGPLRVQRALYPEGEAVCHLVILHPPGGIAGGDQLQIQVTLDARAEALLTTPGSGKWYRSAGRWARQDVNLSVADGAVLEWLPQEAVLFEAAHAAQTLQLDLHGTAACLGWDIVQLGRVAAGEDWRSGQFRQTLTITRDGRWLWREHTDLRADDPLRASPLGLDACPVFATLWASSPRLSQQAELAMDSLRATLGPHGLHADAVSSQSLRVAASYLPAPADLLLLRVLGHDVEAVRAQLEIAWRVLRPWLNGRAAQAPRIWST